MLLKCLNIAGVRTESRVSLVAPGVLQSGTNIQHDSQCVSNKSHLHSQ